MKKSKLWFLAALLLIVCLFAVSCKEEHTHTYTYDITTAPTETTVGKAVGTCSCGETAEFDVPALTDATWTASTTPATHSEDGKTVYTSEIWGTVEVVIPKLTEHTWGAWTITVEPTESDTGSATRTCTKDGEIDTATVPALSDSSVWTRKATVVANHTTTGSKTYTSVYGTVTVTIPKTAEHTWGAWTITDEPTESDTGSATRSCTADSATDTATVPALSDTSVWTVSATVPATHTSTGSRTYTSEYGTVTVTLPQLSHTWGAWNITVEPTESDPGSATRTCTEDSATDTATVPALSDTSVWTVSATVPATHTSTGSKTYTSEYGTVTVTVPKLTEHIWGAWTITVEPTESGTGSATRTCTAGDATDTVTVPALSDTSVWTVTDTVPATHASTGSKTYTSVYGTVTVTIPKTSEHTWGAWTITAEPTESGTGSATRSCSADDATDTVTVPALSDTSVWTVTDTVPATHASTGSKTYTSVYGTVTVTIPKTSEHTWGAWTITTEPTESGTGSATRSCSEDGATDTVTVPALSDTSVWTVTNTVPATYNAAGSKTYTSVYGDVTVTLPKLVAPYDGKTYTAVQFDGSSGIDKVISAETSWNTASLTLDENGAGFGTAYPFRGYTVITMEDAATGKVKITLYSADFSDPENPVVDDSKTPSVYYGYVDFATGIIIRTRDASFNNVFLMTPFESGLTSDKVKCSVWSGNAMAIAYTYAETTYTAFIYNDTVTFGVSFTDAAGTAVEADACYNAPYVYVKDSEGTLLVSFGYDGTDHYVLDGLEGTYTDAEVAGDSVAVSGYGTLVYTGIGGTINGTYTAAPADAAYDLDVYFLNGEGAVVGYYQVTLGAGSTYTKVAPQVTVTYDAGEYATESPVTVNVNVPLTLPVPTNATMILKGWKLPDGTVITGSYTPTADVTLTAVWAPKCVVTLIDVLAEDAGTLYLGAGDVIGDYLPAYTTATLDEVNWRHFVGWYLDMNNNGVYDKDTDVSIDPDSEITEDLTAITIIAVWEDLPAYYGTYTGGELFGNGSSSYSNRGGKTLTINKDGEISGLITGIVVAYDPATQRVTWKTSAAATTEKYFYFDAETGIIAGIYNDTIIGTDYYLLSRYGASDGKYSAQYGIYTSYTKANGSTDTDYAAQFVTVTGKDGAPVDIFLYNNYIYSGFVLTNTLGETLTIPTIKDSKTVVVKDAETGAMIFGCTSAGTSFNSSNGKTNKTLDSYFGTYTVTGSETETVILDGTRGLTYGDKSGIYTISEDSTYFDVYIVVDSENTEYYRLTLDVSAGTCALEKPMVTVTLDVDGKTLTAPLTQPGSVNQNIALTLPSPDSEAYYFRGWYVEGDSSQTLVSMTYVPTSDVTLVAKWDNKYTFTIVYNDGNTENTVEVHGEGDVLTVANPKYSGHKFLGWYTTATFEKDTVWTSGATITSDTVIYAKWGEAPAYSNTYPINMEFGGTTANGGTSDGYTRVFNLVIEPDDTATATMYPFSSSGTITVRNYNAETGYLEFVYVNSSGTTSVYVAYFDSVTKLIVMNRQSGVDTPVEQVYLFSPYDTTTPASGNRLGSYWNSGATRCITYIAGGTTYNIFIMDGIVYFGVSFEDAEGNAILGNACYQASTLIVKDREGNRIAKFGYDGTTMQTLDGYEGTYTCADQPAMVLSGYNTLQYGETAGTYTKQDGSDNTFEVYLLGEDGARVGYYIMTLDTATHTYSMTAPTVQVTYSSAHGTTPEAQTVNQNIAIVLPTDLTDSDYIFRGWYVEGDETMTLVTSLTPTAAVTLVAKWDAKVTLTVNYGNGMEQVVLAYGTGDVTAPVAPPYTNGKAFSYWALDEAGETRYTPAAISENTVIWCIWVDSVPMIGDYSGAELYGSSSGGTISGGTSSKDISIDCVGHVTGHRTGDIKDYNAETGYFKLYTSDTTWYYGYFNAELGYIMYSDSSGKETFGYDFYLFFLDADSALLPASSYGTNINSGKTKFFTIRVVKGEKTVDRNVYFANDTVYLDVTFTSTDGAVEVNKIHNLSNVSVLKEENLIAYYKKSGGYLVLTEIDGYQGTYYTSGTENALVLDGYGSITVTNAALDLTEATGAYTLAADGSSYTMDVTIGGINYELTLDRENGLYTITKPEFSVTFDTDGKVDIPSQTVGKGLEFTMPESPTADGFVFKGWYKEPAFTTRVYYAFAVTENVTLYAKWVPAVTLTVHNADGAGNDSVRTYEAGSTVSLNASAYAGGAAFAGYFTDEGCTVAYEAGTISENTEIWAKWITFDGFTVSANDTYTFVYSAGETGATFTSNNQSKGNSTAKLTITFTSDCTVSFSYMVSSEAKYDKFTIQLGDETIASQISGTVDWTEVTRTVSAGTTLTLTYSKDGSGNNGSDTAAIKNLVVTASSAN